MIAGNRPEARLIDTEPTLAVLMVAKEGEEEDLLLFVGSRRLGAAQQAMLRSVWTRVLRAARGPSARVPARKKNRGMKEAHRDELQTETRSLPA